jgi:hypothetical protein
LLRLRPELFDFPAKLSKVLDRNARDSDQAKQSASRSHFVVQTFHSENSRNGVDKKERYEFAEKRREKSQRFSKF